METTIIEKIRKNHYELIREIGYPPEQRPSSRIYPKGLRKTRWTLFQLLSMHPNPKKILFLGATLGGDILGAVESGITVTVLDRDQEILDELNNLNTKIQCINSDANNLPEMEKFDIIFISPWWVINVNRSKISWGHHIENVLHYLQPDGSLFIYGLISKPNGLLMKLTGCPVSTEFRHKLLLVPNRQIELLLNERGLLKTVYHVYRDYINPHYVFASKFEGKHLAGLDFEKSSHWKCQVLGWLSGIFEFLKVPYSRLYPATLLCFHKNQVGFNSLDPMWLKVSKQIVTSIGEYDGKLRYFRHSSKNGTWSSEQEIMQYVSTNKYIQKHINIPLANVVVSGVPSLIYPFIDGQMISNQESVKYGEQVINFLQELSAVEAPEFLPSGYKTLKELISKNFNGDNFTNNQLDAIEALERLQQKDSFNYITHGDLYPSNFLIRNSDQNLIIIDWAQTYKGHPLLDWWIYRYTKEIPDHDPEIPDVLRLGLDKQNLEDLWLVWKSAYKVSI